MTTSELQPEQAADAAEWVAESIRLTFFFTGAPPESLDLWKQITQKEPETVISKPAAGTKHAAGAFGKGQLVIQQALQRVDFIYGPPEPNPETLSLSPFVQIGPMREAVDLFKSKLHIMNKIQGSCARVAYCPAGIVIGKSAADSNRVFMRYNKDFSMDPDNDEDLALQINRPLTSMVDPAIKFNRIYKWQVAEFGLMNFVPGSQAITAISSASMCRLELDLSTPPSGAATLDETLRMRFIKEFDGAALSIFGLA